MLLLAISAKDMSKALACMGTGAMHADMLVGAPLCSGSTL